MDGADCGYYDPEVDAEVYDPNGDQVASQDASGATCSDAEATLSVTPQASGTYTADGYHFLQEDQYSSYCPGTGESGCWVDYDNWEWWSAWGEDDFAGFDFSLPPGGPQYSANNPVILGVTYDEASDTVQVPCGDDRDQIIAEYHEFGVPWIPACTNFTSSSPNGQWSFSQLNSGDYPDWAIIQQDLKDGLSAMDAWLAQHTNGLRVQLTSAYRNPQKEHDVDVGQGLRYYPDSRHQMGDAADMATNGGNWQSFHDAGKESQPVACIEPQGESGASHLHADWRVEDTSVGVPGPSACPVSPVYGAW